MTKSQIPSSSSFRNGREARNRAEKHRRDKLNGSIQELSTMVPHVAESPRRVDKTAVLRFSAHGLRIDYGESRWQCLHRHTQAQLVCQQRTLSCAQSANRDN